MIKVYIAGPYRAITEWDLEKNIRAAEEAALYFWSLGYAVYCPHKNTSRFGGAALLQDEVWLKGHIEFLKLCDIMVVVGYYNFSKGTLREIEVAKANRIPILLYSDVKNHDHGHIVKDTINNLLKDSAKGCKVCGRGTIRL